MAKEKQEKRYRVPTTMYAPLWHDLFQCHVTPGEDYNMDCHFPDGRKWKYPDDVQTYLNSGMLEIYFCPPNTPHVVHSLGLREHVDQDTGEHSEVMEYTSAAKQWAGESKFIERYTPTEIQETAKVKE